MFVKFTRVLTSILLYFLFSFSCHNHSNRPPCLKVAIAGTEGYISEVLRPFVERFHSKPLWQSYLRFLIVPLGRFENRLKPGAVIQRHKLIIAVRGVATGGGVSHTLPPLPPIFFFLKPGKFGQTKGKFCHKWQHLWLLAHPIKFVQFYKNSIFGRFNEHTPPIKVVSRHP